MTSIAQNDLNPLARIALATPAWLGKALTVAGRLAGAALALNIAVDQSYDRTRWLALALAVVTLVTFLPVRGRFSTRLPWIGAGVLFFGGALLAGFTAGAAMLVAGVLAGVGAAIDDRRSDRMTGVPSFFTGFGVTALLVTLAVFGIEG